MLFVPAKSASVKCNQPTQVLVFNEAELLFLGLDNIGTQKQHYVFFNRSDFESNQNFFLPVGGTNDAGENPARPGCLSKFYS